MGAFSAPHDNLFQGKGQGIRRGRWPSNLSLGRHRPRTVAIQPELGETSTITASMPAEVVLTAGEMK